MAFPFLEHYLLTEEEIEKLSLMDMGRICIAKEDAYFIKYRFNTLLDMYNEVKDMSKKQKELITLYNTFMLKLKETELSQDQKEIFNVFEKNISSILMDL